MATMQTDGFNTASAIPMDNLSAGNNSDMTNPGWIDVTKYSEFQVLMLFCPSNWRYLFLNSWLQLIIPTYIIGPLSIVQILNDGSFFSFV